MKQPSKKLYDEIQKKWTDFRLDENQTFTSGAGGLTPIDTSMLIIPNTIYKIGSSSSPDSIFVEKLDDKFIYYRKIEWGDKPYGSLIKIDRKIGADLIKTGCETWIKTHGQYFPKIKKTYILNIQGKKSSNNGKDKLKDWEYRYVTCVGVKNTKDLYGDTKSYGVLIHFSGENTGEGGETRIMVRNYIVDDMKKDKSFKVVKVDTKE